jgi:hypothetical protein
MSAGTIILSLLLAGIVALIIRKLIKDRKNGKASCCGGCAHCALNCTCQKKA